MWIKLKLENHGYSLVNLLNITFIEKKQDHIEFVTNDGKKIRSFEDPSTIDESFNKLTLKLMEK